MAGQIVLSRGDVTSVPAPSSGKSTLFVDEADGLFKLKDDEGNVHEAGGGAVASVFGRTGVVVAEAGDYSASDITGLGSAATHPAGDFDSAGAAAAAQAASQPVASGLTAIAALAPEEGAILVRSGGTWAALAKGNAGQELVVRSDGTVGWVDPVVYNIEAWGAKPDAFYTDGEATSASTTFKSATANFTAEDVGKNIVALRAGSSNFQDLHTTISEVKSATEVKLANSAGRSQSSCRFYISRSGDQNTPITEAIEAAWKAGGGTVYGPGPGYLVSGLTLKNRVWLKGAGHHATMFHLKGSANVPVIQNDHTENDSAQSCGVLDAWIDGNRSRQTALSTTLASKYTKGDSVLKLTSAAGFLPSGSVLVGTNRIFYRSKSGNELTLDAANSTAGREGTTDEDVAAGATVVLNNSHGVYWAPVPYNSNPTLADSTDVPMHLVENCYIKNCNGDGVSQWGFSESRIRNVFAHYCDQFGFRPGFDSHTSDSTADTCGRAGFYLGYSEAKLTDCKSFSNGGSVAAEGYGFFCEGPATTTEEGNKILSACSAQDNKADGFYFRNAGRVMAQVSSSSNGTSSAGTYVGVKIDGAYHGILDLMAVERQASSTQKNALNFLNTKRTTQSMKIRCTHGGTSGATIGTAIKEGSDLSGGIDISINGMGAFIAPAYTAEYTPDPYEATTHKIGALTGKLTVKAPANAHLGCKLRFILLQDGTGGREVAWNEAFSTIYANTGNTKEKKLVIDFEYDGTKWQQVNISPSATAGTYWF